MSAVATLIWTLLTRSDKLRALPESNRKPAAGRSVSECPLGRFFHWHRWLISIAGSPRVRAETQVAVVGYRRRGRGLRSAGELR
jgi:hypothetical protein